jgi:hypothetical protein
MNRLRLSHTWSQNRTSLPAGRVRQKLKVESSGHARRVSAELRHSNSRGGVKPGAAGAELPCTAV